MANAARQEVDIRFSGRIITIRPTAALIKGVEAANGGKSCMATGYKFYQNDPLNYATFTETCATLYAMLAPFDKDLTLEQVDDAVFDDGEAEYWPQMAPFLCQVFRGHREHIKMAEERTRQAREAGEADKPVDPPLGTQNGGKPSA